MIIKLKEKYEDYNELLKDIKGYFNQDLNVVVSYDRRHSSPTFNIDFFNGEEKTYLTINLFGINSNTVSRELGGEHEPTYVYPFNYDTEQGSYLESKGRGKKKFWEFIDTYFRTTFEISDFEWDFTSYYMISKDCYGKITSFA